MSVIYLLISVSFLVAVAFLVAFAWAIKSGQFKDKQTPAMRILFDDNNDSIENNQE
ncbi:MAG: cbb3-type cytochrome oxidase assembly protein CcoS [Calditrichaeota bacterium]|nr:cbb3-type cytochrome oxidase assembly protein CcoS [Calditrichota bacterium]